MFCELFVQTIIYTYSVRYMCNAHSRFYLHLCWWKYVQTYWPVIVLKIFYNKQVNSFLKCLHECLFYSGWNDKSVILLTLRTNYTERKFTFSLYKLRFHSNYFIDLHRNWQIVTKHQYLVLHVKHVPTVTIPQAERRVWF